MQYDLAYLVVRAVIVYTALLYNYNVNTVFIFVLYHTEYLISMGI